jgi:PilZ domain
MTPPTSAVIVRPEHLPALRKRVAGADDVAVCSELELHAHAAILAHPPAIVVMHSTFATTSRGATLVAGLKDHPHPGGTAVRVFIEDEDKAPLILFQTTLAPDLALLETSRPLDRAGTRQAARYPMNRRAAVVNGEPCLLIDLSVSGAQVQVPMRLRPSEVVRFALPEESGDARCQGTVAWSIAVPSGGMIHYRAGLEFINPDAARLASLCARHGGAPDRGRIE